MAISSTPQHEALERGDIYFLYRPAVGEENPKSLLDVQRFLVVLKPEGQNLFRLLIIGRKRLPKTDEHERFWGFVDAVTHSANALERSLRESEYETQTRGRRHAPAVGPAGAGLY